MPKVTPNETLTTPLVYATEAPFPTIRVSEKDPADVDETGDDLSVQYEPSPTEKVQVQVCSELSFFTRPFDLFDNAGPSSKETQRKLTLTHDSNGQPIVFAISNTGRLHAIFHINNAVAGWQSLDITPALENVDSKVDNFDTLELDKRMHIVVSLETIQGSTITQTLWHATINRPDLSADELTADVTGLPDLQWKPITYGFSDRDITSLLCCPSVSSTAGFYICAGTRTHNTSAATQYILDPAAGSETLWHDIVMSGSPDQLLSLQPVCLGSFDDRTNRKVGVASLYRQTGNNTQQVCSIEELDERTAQRIRTYVLQTGQLGSVNGIFSSVNPWGLTDIIVAGENGIGYYESSNIASLATEPLLPEISFKQVVCSEVYGTPHDNLTIFAISDHNELYFIEGTRSEDNEIAFRKPSGIPIRQGVSIMSPQYNAKSNASELLYVTDSNANGLRHLIRDPVSALWSEDSVNIKVSPGTTPSHLTKVPVYMTSITMANDMDLPVPEGYSVTVTCEPHVHISCNGRSFVLNGKPTKLSTHDGSGQIDLILPVDPLMGSCIIKMRLSEFLADKVVPEIITINPAQRVMNGLGAVSSEADLRNARGPNGEAIFQDNAKIAECSALLANFGSMAKQLSPDSAEANTSISSRKGRGEQTLSWEANKDTAREDQDTSWFENASASLGRYLGDAIEYMKTAVKTVVKFAVKTVGKVIMFGLRIAGKVFSFVLKGVTVLLKAVCGILNFLGIDTSGLTKWLALAFNTENVKKTQMAFKHSLNTILDVTQNFLIANKYRVADLLEDVEDTCKTVLPDSRPPRTDRSSSKPSWLSKILNNPVVKALLKLNPFSWVLEAMNEGIEETLGGKLVIPSLQSILEPFRSLLGNTTKSITDLLLRLFEAVWAEMKNLIANPGKILQILVRILADVFYTAFDAMKVFVLAAFDALVAALSAFREVLIAKWVIPGLTDVWEKDIGQEFSIFNFGTYFPAQFLNLIFLFTSSESELPFDGRDFPQAGDLPIPLLSTKKMKDQANQPPGLYDLVVMTGSVNTYNTKDKNIKWRCDLCNNLGTMVRCIGGIMDTYTLGIESRQGSRKSKIRTKGVDGRLDANRGPNIVSINAKKVKMTQVSPGIELTGVPKPRMGAKFRPGKQPPKNFGDIDPDLAGRRGANIPLDETETAELRKALFEPNKIWQTGTILTNFIGFGLSVFVLVDQQGLPDYEDDSSQVRCQIANAVLQFGGCIMTCYGICYDKERFTQLGGILLQTGAVVEWVGTLSDRNGDSEPLSWGQIADMAGCGCGLTASVLSVTVCGKAYAPYFSGGDLVAASISCCCGMIEMFKD